ncbi:hypothetical protein RA28_05810 [Ruegeria sp. ANG-S4]|uniref:hypothetical protein n=1 Tax=Ruegeria sp. ANG-S4 TaxID=1577904 RepID=UPI00057D5079|nr:hypothetical protein [Ruegeria sp. ANG-S4]KIC47194.1 hypothetical protein RA28_05810 [Ruegeria sp. ANG-S4]
MSEKCPYCLKEDIADGAQKCQHCGSWLREEKRADEFEAFRRDVRAEMAQGLEKHQAALSTDLEKHRSHIEKLLGRMQIFAGVIAAVAGAFAIYFTGVTKENITETTRRIEQDASNRVQNAADQAAHKAIESADESVRQHVRSAISERLDSEATQQLIERTIRESVNRSVAVEVDERIQDVRREVDERTEDARAQLDFATKKIDSVRDEAETALAAAQELQTETEQAVASVRGIEASFASAQVLDVSTNRSVLEFQTVRGSGKEGLDVLESLVADRINALTFNVGSNEYWAPIVWKYINVLTEEPQFQWVVLQSSEGRGALGFWDASQLAQALNPPFNQELIEVHGNDMFAIPSEDEIVKWRSFTDALNSGDLDSLSQVEGYHPVAAPVEAQWSNFSALSHMLEVGADQLPVIDAEGALVGFVDRSRLTTRMLVKVASE